MLQAWLGQMRQGALLRAGLARACELLQQRVGTQPGGGPTTLNEVLQQVSERHSGLTGCGV